MVPRLLVPLSLPEASPVSGQLIESLSGLEVVLLGHYQLPEQTPPDAARQQFRGEAQNEVDAIAADFQDEGVRVKTRLLFGQDLEKAIEQVANEEDCGAVLDPAPSKRIERLFVPVLDAGSLDRLVEYVHAISNRTETAIILGHVVAKGGRVADAEELLDEVRHRLVNLGTDENMISIEIVESETRDAAIMELAGDHDAVVMKEPDPTVAEWIIGTLPERIARHTMAPVILVFRQE